MEHFPSALPSASINIEKLIYKHEHSFKPLKKDNNAQIIWADKHQKEKTAYSIVYLHGFGASWGEGDPWHRAVAQKFNCNLYLARLHSHGLKRRNFFKNFTYQKYLNSAIEACRIGQQIGENVLVMGTSAGGALALYAAGSKQCPVSVKALMLCSPLIHLYSYESLFLENKVGRYLAKLIKGNSYKRRLNTNKAIARETIWYPYIPIKAALELGKMVEKILSPNLFKNVQCPVFTGYYNKDSLFHDRAVSPHAIPSMVQMLGTSPNERYTANFPKAQAHVICNGLLSKSVPELITQTVLFLKNIGLKSV